MMRRSTDDMDALVDYWADRSSLTAARVTLARIGFDLVESEQTPTDSCTATAAR